MLFKPPWEDHWGTRAISAHHEHIQRLTRTVSLRYVLLLGRELDHQKHSGDVSFERFPEFRGKPCQRLLLVQKYSLFGIMQCILAESPRIHQNPR